MGIEIERKFLLADDGWRAVISHGERMTQGYLVGAEALRMGAARASVRVRVAGDAACLNIKQAVTGVARAEYDVPLPVAEARELLATLCGGVLEKVRHHVHAGGVEFEIDEFGGANAGLVVAEVELRAVDQPVPRPAWLGREVTDRARYYNVNLIQHPFCDWTEAERAGC